MSSLLLALILVAGLGISAFAADTSVTYEGEADQFVFRVGSKAANSTDLFDGFKDVLPGDELTQIITMKNNATDSDYIKLYLRAQPLEEDENSAAVLDFLSQLSMKVYSGSDLIFDDTADQADGLAENVFLGELRSGEKVVLTVELSVPIELENEYAGLAGTVSWVFTAEAYDDEPEPTPTPEPTPEPEPTPTPEPEPTPTTEPTAKPTSTPKSGSKTPKTGDETVIWPYVVGVIVCLALIAYFLLRAKKKKA